MTIFGKSQGKTGNNKLKVRGKLLFLGKSQGDFVQTARINPAKSIPYHASYLGSGLEVIETLV